MLKQFLSTLFVICVSLNTYAQPLNTPDIQCVSVLPNGDVEITWNQIGDPNGLFQSYNVFNAGGLLASIGSISTLNYIHLGAGGNNASQQFYMQSIANNPADNSGNSGLVNSMFLQVNNPGNGTAWLNWNPISVPKLAGASDYYHIYREYPAGTWTLIDSTMYGNESFIDTVTVCNALLNYKIVMENGNCSSESNVDGGFFQDLIAPDIPVLEQVEVDTANGNVLIDWFPTNSGDTEAYIVFFFDGSGWVIIDTVWGYNNTSFVHLGAGADGQSINYGIAAFDSCWTGGTPNTSALGVDHNTVYLEQTPRICDMGFDFSWNAYKNWPVGGVVQYQLFGSENNGPFTSYGVSSSLSTTVSGLNPNSSYTFVLKALAASGETSLSNKLELTVYTPVQPTVGYLTTATVQGDQVRVDYLGDPTASLQSIQIERASSALGPFTAIGNTAVTGAITSYLDQTANPSLQSYYYRVVAIDTCGNASIISNIGKNIHAKIQSDQDYFKNTITWNYYEDWDGGIQEYEVYRSINGVYDALPIATLNNAADILEDDVSQLLDSKGRFCYYIKAIESTNSYGFQEESNSNEVCAEMGTIIWVPNAMVVGGVNNVFKPVMGYFDFDDYNMRIYDRWGQVIFESNDINIGWDGSDPKGEQSLGVYIYQISYRDSEGSYNDKKGSVTVVK